MGDYTWFQFTAEFKPDNFAVPVIQYLVDTQAPKKERMHLPMHDLFNDNNRHKYFLCSGSEEHISGRTQFRWDEHAERYWLSVDTSFKHHNEIPLFLSWLSPYDVDGHDGFRGLYLPAYNEHPSLIYRRLGGYTFRGAGLQERPFLGAVNPYKKTAKTSEERYAKQASKPPKSKGI